MLTVEDLINKEEVDVLWVLEEIEDKKANEEIIQQMLKKIGLIPK